MLNPTPRVSESDERAVSELTVRTLFDSEETPLLRYAFSLVGRRAVAEEIVQDVFLQLHIHWNEIESPKSWLFRSVRNGVYNYLRKNKREVLQSKEKDDRTSDEALQPEELMQRIESTRALREILNELTETDQQIIRLRYFEGLKYRDIAETTGLTVSNVGYRLHHILKDLSHKLRPLGIDETT